MAWLNLFIPYAASLGVCAAQQVSPRVISAQTVRAILLAMATVAIRAGFRASSDLPYLLIGAEGLPGHDHEHLHSMTGQVRHFFALNDLSRQHQSSFETLRNIDADFRELPPDHVHQLSSLLHQKVARAVKGQHCLLFT